jgi:hypothetical protein
MEKGSDRSQEINLKLQLIKNELMSALGPKTRPKSSKKELKKSENKSNKKQISDEVKEDSKVGTKNKNSKSKISTKSEKNKTMSNRKKEVDLSQKTSTKKKKKSSPSEENEIETDITTRKWDDGKGRKLEKGVFTLEEEKKVMDAICEYAYSNDLGESELIDLITEKQTKKDSKVWTKISECLPNRSVQSIHNFCHRKFNPYNYKGNWTNEEVENLIQLHKEHGSKWELIGKELERTATNVKDKFRQIGGKNFKSRVKEFNLVLCLKMLKYIQEYLNENEKNPELQILKYSYKFKNNVEEQYKNVFHIFEDNYKCLIDSSIKETPSRIIIRNILKLIVDTEVLEKILEENCEISWNSIAEKFSIYSATDCKNNWDKILREFDLWEKGQLRKDLKMIRR